MLNLVWFSRVLPQLHFLCVLVLPFYLYVVLVASSGLLTEAGLWIVLLKDIKDSYHDPFWWVSIWPGSAIAMPQFMLQKCICCFACHMPYLLHAPSKSHLHIVAFFLSWMTCTRHLKVQMWNIHSRLVNSLAQVELVADN